MFDRDSLYSEALQLIDDFDINPGDSLVLQPQKEKEENKKEEKKALETKESKQGNNKKNENKREKILLSTIQDENAYIPWLANDKIDLADQSEMDDFFKINSQDYNAYTISSNTKILTKLQQQQGMQRKLQEAVTEVEQKQQTVTTSVKEEEQKWQAVIAAAKEEEQKRQALEAVIKEIERNQREVAAAAKEEEQKQREIVTAIEEEKQKSQAVAVLTEQELKLQEVIAVADEEKQIWEEQEALYKLGEKLNRLEKRLDKLEEEQKELEKSEESEDSEDSEEYRKEKQMILLSEIKDGAPYINGVESAWDAKIPGRGKLTKDRCLIRVGYEDAVNYNQFLKRHYSLPGGAKSYSANLKIDIDEQGNTFYEGKQFKISRYYDKNKFNIQKSDLESDSDSDTNSDYIAEKTFVVPDLSFIKTPRTNVSVYLKDGSPVNKKDMKLIVSRGKIREINGKRIVTEYYYHELNTYAYKKSICHDEWGRIAYKRVAPGLKLEAKLNGKLFCSKEEVINLRDAREERKKKAKPAAFNDTSHQWKKDEKIIIEVKDSHPVIDGKSFNWGDKIGEKKLSQRNCFVMINNEEIDYHVFLNRSIRISGKLLDRKQKSQIDIIKKGDSYKTYYEGEEFEIIESKYHHPGPKAKSTKKNTEEQDKIEKKDKTPTSQTQLLGSTVRLFSGATRMTEAKRKAEDELQHDRSAKRKKR